MASFLDAPIPGQSLTDEPKNWPWENPPELNTPEEAIEYYITRMADEELMDDLAAMLSTGLPVAPVVKTLLTTGVMNGKHSIDISIIIAPVLHTFIKASMTTYGIEVKDDIEDPAELIKEKEKKRLMSAIKMAMVKAKDSPEEDPGVKMLEELQDTLDEPTEVEAPTEELEMGMDEGMEPEAPAGLMSKEV